MRLTLDGIMERVNCHGRLMSTSLSSTNKPGAVQRQGAGKTIRRKSQVFASDKGAELAAITKTHVAEARNRTLAQAVANQSLLKSSSYHFAIAFSAVRVSCRRSSTARSTFIGCWSPAFPIGV